MIKKIAPNIFISGANEIHNKEELKGLGITAILNVAWEVNDPEYSPEDFKMVKVGLLDSSNNPDWLKSLAIIAFGSLVENGEIVLIHCLHGASRSPYIALRYLAEKEKRAIENLYDEFMPQFPPGQINISPLNYNV